MEDYKNYSFALLTSVQKPAVTIPALGIASLTSCQMGFALLLFLLFLDFVSGVGASWIIWKRDPLNKGLKFRKKGFSSERVRMSLVKCVTYFLLIICTYFLESIFKLKSFTLETYTDHKVTITLITIAITCAIEFYSIFFENLPKAGFSIESNVKVIYNKAKTAYTALKNFKNGSNGPA